TNKQLRVERLFLSRPIQDILIEKFIVRNKSIEAKKRWHAVDPKIALLTDNEVKELERRQNSEIFVSTCKLSPFRFPKVCETKIIQKDPELNNWFSRVKCDHKFALVDLSKNQPPFKRKCFIREMNGELRTTGLDEKYKLLNIFYPRDEYVYKFPILPKYLAHNELLDKMLHKKSYEYLLDSLVYFLRPEQERFCQLLSKIYDVIIDRQDYGCIEHSRHFGSFIFYSIVTKKYAEFIMSLANRNMA
ncbi:MAG: 28S ribosomal protein S22, mitochondrial, partial [Marteilia pararefringens]